MTRDEIVSRLSEELINGIEMSKTQFPELCKQIAKYGVVSNIWQIIIGCLISLSLFITAKVLVNKYKEEIKDGRVGETIFTGFTIIILFIFIPTMMQVTPLLKAIFTPYVYVLDYLKY